MLPKYLYSVKEDEEHSSLYFLATPLLGTNILTYRGSSEEDMAQTRREDGKRRNIKIIM